jgi:hypothetical protein
MRMDIKDKLKFARNPNKSSVDLQPSREAHIYEINKISHVAIKQQDPSVMQGHRYDDMKFLQGEDFDLSSPDIIVSGKAQDRGAMQAQIYMGSYSG